MVKITMLTYLTFQLNALVDHDLSIPLKETKMLCEEKRIIEELEKRFSREETGLDLSMFNLWKREYGVDVRKELNEIFWDMAVAIDERKKMGIENNGLCLLIAYAQEQIQRELGEKE